MCRTLGWGEPTKGRLGQVNVKLDPNGSDNMYSNNVLRFDLRNGDILYDEDHPELKKAAEMVDIEYRIADVIMTAEDNNYDWERDVNSEGTPTLRVILPDHVELGSEVDYE